MLGLKTVILLVLLQHLCLSKKLPEVFRTCKINSTDIGKCAEENANYVLPEIVKGISELNMLPLTNLKVPKINSPSYLPYKFNFDGDLTDLEGITYRMDQFDMNNFAIHGTLLLPKLELKGKYNIEGFVGVTIRGEGFAKITLHNVSISGGWSFGIKLHDGVDYFKLTTLALTSYKVESISYHLDNLYDGDKVKAEKASYLLNGNWLLLAGNFLPHVPIFITEIAYKTCNKVLTDVAFNEVFLL